MRSSSEEDHFRCPRLNLNIVMLDNFSLDNAKAALSKLCDLGLRNRVLVEISESYQRV